MKTKNHISLGLGITLFMSIFINVIQFIDSSKEKDMKKYIYEPVRGDRVYVKSGFDRGCTGIVDDKVDRRYLIECENRKNKDVFVWVNKDEIERVEDTTINETICYFGSDNK